MLGDDEEYHTAHYIESRGNGHIGQIETEADAAHIVHCVNAHDALTARITELENALEDCLTAMRNGAPGNKFSCPPYRTLAYTNGRKVLRNSAALAEVQQ